MLFFPNSLFELPQRTDYIGGKEEQHIVYITDFCKKKKTTKMREMAIQKEREIESSQSLG